MGRRRKKDILKYAEHVDIHVEKARKHLLINRRVSREI